jgi:hypothetical protein
MSNAQTSMGKYFSWSKPAATNAPVEDEAIQAILGMNQKHILPYPKFLKILSLFSVPKFFPPTYLPPTYLPLSTSLPPTSPLLPTSPHFVLTPSSELGRTWSGSHDRVREELGQAKAKAWR